MSEMIRAIRFEHFRGLPDSDISLKGKSLVLLGSNGKGKSAVVDGIEFLFSGQVSRFVGTGTGSIDHDDAIQHVKKLGVPKVTLSLSPSSGTISRSLDSETLSATDRQEVRDYLTTHPGVDAFILRRSKILDFVCDQDADRYRKFVQLLGISHLDSLQRTFVEAERQARDSAQRARTTYLTKLAAFRDPVNKFEPQSLAQILAHISDRLASFGLEKLTRWSDAEPRLALLKRMRPEANKEKIDALTRALVSLEDPLPPEIGAEIATANALRQRLTTLSTSSVDAPRSNVIAEAVGYPFKEDGRPHRLLFSWEDEIFAEGTATITRQIDEADRKHGHQFAFVLLQYRRRRKITLEQLPLGKRRTTHRSLIRLTRQVLAAYDRKKR